MSIEPRVAVVVALFVAIAHVPGLAASHERAQASSKQTKAGPSH